MKTQTSIPLNYYTSKSRRKDQREIALSAAANPFKKMAQQSRRGPSISLEEEKLPNKSISASMTEAPWELAIELSRKIDYEHPDYVFL